MCGFAGWIWSSSNALSGAADAVARMAGAIRYRGPDSDGIIDAPFMRAAFRRLSIIDLSTGDQPCSNDSGDIQVFLNGEIYNHQDLRADLERDGIRTRGHSDTSILPFLYEKYGDDFVELLNGMFAILVCDHRRKRAVLYRDRLGIKPLYYAHIPRHPGGGVAFASEIKSLLAGGLVHREIDEASLLGALEYFYFPGNDTLIRGVKKLGPGQNPKVIVVKSTVPVGTTFAVKERVKKIVGNLPFHVADNPEFLKEGAAINDFNYPDRVVCGVENEETGEMMRELYAPFVRQGNPIYIMDVLSAEMVKYASNNFLATKISFINEMANLCEAYGANIAKVREGMCADKRIGNQFLYPGLGYGGSCFPKDTLACIQMGKQKGIETQLSQAVHDVNQRQRKHFWKKIEAHFAKGGSVKGKTLAFWGMAFKPHTDDIREAPAVDLMKWAKQAGATVRGFDPVAAENVEKENPSQFEISDGMYETLRGSHALVISTDWDEFKTPDFEKIKALMAEPVIFDGRNLYKREQMERQGFTYHSVGRAPVVGQKVAR